MPPRFVVYCVRGKPGRGVYLRTYVGCCMIHVWDPSGTGNPDEARDARVACHFTRPCPKVSAAWLRACTDPSGVQTLHTCTTLSEALWYELYFTLVMMHTCGRFLTRGGPFVRIALPWAEITPFFDAAVDPHSGVTVSFAVFKARVLTMDLSSDICAHLASRCYNCGRAHLVKDCRSPGPETKPENRAQFAAHFIPTPTAVWWDKSRGGRWRFLVQSKSRNLSKKTKLLAISVVAHGGGWQLVFQRSVLATFESEIECIHQGALEAAERCDVALKRGRQKRPASASVAHADSDPQ